MMTVSRMNQYLGNAMKICAFMIAQGLMSGCLPSPYFNYYAPSYPDPSAKTTRQSCNDGAGPATNLAFTIPDGVEVSVNATRDYFQKKMEGLPVNLTMKIPYDVRVHFLSDSVRISDARGTDIKTDKGLITVVASSNRFSSLREIDLDRDGPVPASLAKTDGFERESQLKMTSRLYFKLPAEEPLPEQLSLKLPEIGVGGRLSNVRPINLHLDRKKSGWRIEYESDEHYRKRYARYEQCVQEKAGGRCENYIENINDGFDEKTSDYRVLGSLIFSENSGAEVALSVRVQYEFNGPEPWRIESDGIDLQSSNGIESHARAEAMDVVFNWYNIPLTTPLSGSPADNTVVRILINAGNKLPGKFFVTLPPLLINGEEFHFQPIEFNYTPASVVIDPFNC